MTEEEKVWIRTNLRYNAEIGVLERLFRGCKWREVTQKANSEGYARVRILSKPYYYHRICWLLVHGSIAGGLDIDHIDGDTLNNKLTNLRLVTHRENSQNMKCHRNGKLVGCRWHKRNKKWQARIQINGKPKHLGYYDTEQEAHAAYNSACILLGV